MPDRDQPAKSNSGSPFQPGAIVVATLGNPREKVWGSVLALTMQGLSLCGIELSSFDDLISTVKQGEEFSPAVVFFPMYRVERLDLDLPSSGIPSLAQIFKAKTGLEAVAVLTCKDLPGQERP